MTDWKARCAELEGLLTKLHEYVHADGRFLLDEDSGAGVYGVELDISIDESLTRTRAALAQPEPEWPTDEELLRCYSWAFAEAIQRGDPTLEAAELAQRAVYDLGRQHGAAQATCPHIRKSDEGTGYCSLAEQTADSQPTPNDRQIRSSAPAGGLLEKISWLIAKRWSESRPGTDCTPFGKEVICKVADAVAETGMLGSNEIAKWLRMRAWGTEDIPQPAPAVGLVEMLADVRSEGEPLHPAARRATIRMVAKWLEQQQEVPIGSTASADYFAAMLREEANQ